MHSIDDATRPVVVWNAHASPEPFIRSEIDDFLKGYWRNLLRSQANLIEIVGEKNTLTSLIRPIAEQYCMSYTLGRGYCSLSPRYQERSESDELARLELRPTGSRLGGGVCEDTLRMALRPIDERREPATAGRDYDPRP